jgi:hypothetical protein
MRLVSGVGEQKLKNYGERFLQAIRDHCRAHGLTTDRGAEASRPTTPAVGPRPQLRPNPQRTQAFTLFREGAVIEDVMHSIGRARTTVVDYLCDFIREERPASLSAWIPEATYRAHRRCARKVGTERLKPVFVALGEQVSYDEIRLVLATLLRTRARLVQFRVMFVGQAALLVAGRGKQGCLPHESRDCQPVWAAFERVEDEAGRSAARSGTGHATLQLRHVAANLGVRRGFVQPAAARGQ